MPTRPLPLAVSRKPALSALLMVDRRHHADGVRHSIAHPPHHRRLGLEPVIVIIEILSWRDQPLMLLLMAS